MCSASRVNQRKGQFRFLESELPAQGSRRSKSGHKTLRVKYDYHTVHADRFRVFKVGPPPEDQPTTARRLRTRVRKGEVVNAVKAARKYQKFLARPEVVGYRDAAKNFGVSKPVVSMHMAIVTRLPAPFIEWLEDCKDKLVLAFFSERRLRPVTRMDGDEATIAGLLELVDQCERELEEENRPLAQLRALLASDPTPSDDGCDARPSPKPRELRAVELD